MRVRTHPSFWRQTAESGSSSSRPPSLQQCHGTYIKNQTTDKATVHDHKNPAFESKNNCMVVLLFEKCTTRRAKAAWMPLQGQVHNKIWFQPGSLHQLPYPWVWYPHPLPPALSLSLLLNSHSIVKWRPPHHHQQTGCQNLAFRDSTTPPFLLSADQHVRLCAHIMHLSVSCLTLSKSSLRTVEIQKKWNMKTGEGLYRRQVLASELRAVCWM